MTTKHTPGPWFVLDKHPDRSCLNIGCGEGFEHEGKVYYSDLATIYSAPGDPNLMPPDGELHCNDPERLANAQLMASAPELLSALQAFVWPYHDGNRLTDTERQAQGRTAIEKAMGQVNRDE